MFETYNIKPMVNHVQFPEMHDMRKAEHEIEFPRLLAPVDGFLEREWPFMWSLHAEAVDGNVRAYRDILRHCPRFSEISCLVIA